MLSLDWKCKGQDGSAGIVILRIVPLSSYYWLDIVGNLSGYATPLGVFLQPQYLY
jgi:hypothetical protein